MKIAITSYKPIRRRKQPMETQNITCKQCQYAWTPRAHSPKQCPKCKRYDYRQTSDTTEVNHHEESKEE